MAPATGAAAAGPGVAAVNDAEFRDWLWFFPAVTVATCIWMLTTGPHLWAAVVASVLIVALLAAYFAFARPRQAGIRANGTRAWVYSGLAVVLFVIAVYFDAGANFALFAIAPQLFLLLSFLPASLMVVALNAGIVAVRLSTDDDPEIVWISIGVAIGTVLLSMFISHRMTAAVDESAARARLIADLQHKQEQIAHLSAEQGRQAERERIAGDVHDTLAQGFTSLVALGQVVAVEIDRNPSAAKAHVAMMTRTARDNLEESRRLIGALAPAQLDDGTLVEAIGRVAETFGQETGIAIEVTASGGMTSLGSASDVVALRVVQEALGNVRKHAGARNATVGLAYTEGVLTVTITDDGTGFDVDAPNDGFGIAGMRTRLERVGGSLAVASRAGAGTSVVARVPVGGGR